MSTQDEGRERDWTLTLLEYRRVVVEMCRTDDDDEWEDLAAKEIILADQLSDRLRAPTARSTPLVAWRPIETAPKDGTKILATGVGLGRWTDVVWWFKGKWRDEGKGYLMGISHWMPLPVSPDAHPVPEDTESAEVERDEGRPQASQLMEVVVRFYVDGDRMIEHLGDGTTLTFKNAFGLSRGWYRVLRALTDTEGGDNE